MKHRSAATALILILLACLGSFLIMVVSAAPGDVDTTFNGTGHARLGFGQGIDKAAGVTMQTDGKIVVVGTTDGLFRNVAVLRYNADGSLDTKFGGLGTGKVQHPLGSTGGFGRAVKMQQDNKIVVAGLAINGDVADFGLLRLKADGSLDDTFGNFGRVITPIGATGDEPYALVIQADGKIVAGGYAVNGSHLDFALVRYHSDGSLDSSFGSGGKVTTTVGAAGFAFVTGLAIQSDGKILAAGSATNGIWRDFALVRYNSNGSVDSSFGGTAGILTGFGADTNDEAAAVAIQTGNAVTPDKIVLAGTSEVAFALARFDLSGSLDPTFGSGGRVVTPFGAGQDQGAALVIQGTGNQLRKILVAGQITTGIDTEIAVARYNADGSLDTSFGSGGKTTAGVTPNGRGRAIALQAGNKIVVAGDTLIAGDPDFEVARFNTDGSLDTSFDNDGKRIDDGDLLAEANAVASQADEKIVVAGYCAVGIFYEFAVARYNPDGSLDTSFSGDGKAFTSVGNDDDMARAVAIQPDGKIVVAGNSVSGSDGHFAVVRYNANGLLDPSFGTAGKVVTAVGTRDSASGVAIQSDGKIVLGGSVILPNGNISFALVRYNSNGSPDNSFGSGGKVTTAVGTSDIGSEVSVQPNGRILLAGYTNLGGSTQFMIVRYNSNGTLDTSFGGTGIVVTTVGATLSVAHAMALQTDGRILVGGQANNGGVALARYNENGSLDPSFDGDGKVVTDAVSGITVVHGLAVQSDGKIVAGGFNDSPISFADFAAVRFNSNGSIDTAYGTNGRVIVDLGNRDSDAAAAIVLDSSGRAVLAGSANNYFMTLRLDGGSLATPTPTPSPSPSPTPSPSPSPSPLVSNVQFSTASYFVNEGSGFANVTVTRTGDTASTVTVDYATTDLGAEQRTDYTITAGTLTLAPGVTAETFPVLIVDDVYVESSETLNLSLSAPTGGAVLGSPSTATLTITDNDAASPTTNPLDNARFFAQQHFYDFLSRFPDQSGWDFWTGQITQCGTDPTCLRNKRIDVSNAFFYELEYQQTGAYVFRLYRAAFGNNQPFPNPDSSNQTESKKLPGYAVFAFDRARVVGGASLAIGQQNIANAFVLRAAFLAKYPASQDGPTFVDAMLNNIRNDTGVDLTSQRTALINLFNAGGRGAVLYRLADDNATGNPINNRAFIDAEYNRAFVATQYFGYLRRDADIGGFLFWLSQVNSAPLRDTSRQHAMVCAFITAAEYQQRFSSVVTHTNAECQ